MLTNQTTSTPTDDREAPSAEDHSLNSIATRIMNTQITTSLDSVLDTRERLAFMAGQIKELKAKLDERLIKWIEANGEITFGTHRIFVGQDKKTKCRALKPALQALMESCGGDWDQFCGCMASDAIKHGAAKSVLGDLWDKHFEVVVKDEIREGETKSVKKLIDADEQFLKPRKKAK